MPGMIEAVLRRREPSSTVIGTISLWNNAISHELEKAPDSQITFVELTTFQGQGPPSVLRRQGIVSLGRALRQLLLHASLGTEPMISWRESTLTHVLQRRLESSKVVVLGSVSQLSRDYELTLGTLNYLRCLLVTPGEAVSSPFRNSGSIQVQLVRDEHSDGADDGMPSNSLYEYARSPQMLEQIVADPRQRLARLFKTSSPLHGFPEINYAPSDDDYQPIDYMDYDDQKYVKGDANQVSTEKGPSDETTSGLINSASQAQIVQLLDSQLPEYYDRRIGVGERILEHFVEDSQGIAGKARKEVMTRDGSGPLGDYSTGGSASEEPGDYQGIITQNGHQEQHSQANGDSPHTLLSYRRSGKSDNMTLSYDEYENIPIDKSNASTVTSGVGYRMIISESDSTRATQMPENSSGPHPSSDRCHQDSHEIESAARTALDVDAQKIEMESLRMQNALQHKKNEENLKRLRYQLDQALDAKQHFEKIAEEAIALKVDLENHLLESRNKLSEALDAADVLQHERIDLLKEQEDSRQRFESISRLHESQLHELQHTIDELKAEQNNLRRNLRDKEHSIRDMTNENQRINTVLDDLRKEKLGLAVSLQENHQELQSTMEQLKTITLELDEVEEEKLKIKHLYSHEEKEVSALKEHSQKMTRECAKLNASLRDRDESMQKLQEGLNLLNCSRLELQSRVRELEQERNQLHEKVVLGDKTLIEIRKNHVQLNLSVQEMKEERDRYDHRHRADETTISVLKEELSFEKAKVAFAERRLYEVENELSGSMKATADLETKNANLERHNLELVESLEKTKDDWKGTILRLTVENQELHDRLRECTTNLLTCQNAKNGMESVLKRFNDTGNLERSWGGRVSLGSSWNNGFEESWNNLEQILAEDKEKMYDDLMCFRSRAKQELHKVRARHEKVVRESEELQSKFAGLKERVFLLERENVKLRYHRKKCLDELRNGRDKIATIAEEEAKSPSTITMLGFRNATSQHHTSRLTPELYLTKSSMGFSGGRV